MAAHPRFDASSQSALITTTSATEFSWTHDATGAASGVCVIGGCQESDSDNAIDIYETVFYGGVKMTKLGFSNINDVDFGSVSMFFLDRPPKGPQTVQVMLNDTVGANAVNRIGGIAMSWSGTQRSKIAGGFSPASSSMGAGGIGGHHGWLSPLGALSAQGRVFTGLHLHSGALVIMGYESGIGSTTNIDAPANWTEAEEFDIGNVCAIYYRNAEPGPLVMTGNHGGNRGSRVVISVVNDDEFDVDDLSPIFATIGAAPPAGVAPTSVLQGPLVGPLGGPI